MTIEVTDKSDSVIVLMRGWSRINDDNTISDKTTIKLYVDPDPYKTYHDKQDGFEPEQEFEDE